MPPVDLEIPARSQYVGVVRLALASLARSAGLDEEKVNDVKIAVSEACATAVLLAESEESAPPIAVRWSDDDDSIVIEISDTAVRPEDSAEPGDSLSFSSRAMMSEALLRSIVDEYHSGPAPSGGTFTRLRIDR